MPTPATPKPLACTTCGTDVTPPPGTTPGTLVICAKCGHLMSMQPGPRLADLTRAQARWVRDHPNFPNIRAAQERIVKPLWG